MAPVELKYIVLLHDLLNYVKIRKTSTKCQNIFENKTFNTNCESFIEKFNSLSLGSIPIEDKENFSFVGNCTGINFSNDSIKIKENSPILHESKKGLNFARLKKIKDSDNIKLLLEKLNNFYYVN